MEFNLVVYSRGNIVILEWMNTFEFDVIKTSVFFSNQTGLDFTIDRSIDDTTATNID